MNKFYILLTATTFFCLTSGEINLHDVEIPDIDDFEVIKEKCERLGGNGTYDKLKASKRVIQNCLTNFVDFNVLKNEVEEAKKTGSMDEVFGKYCKKRPKLQECVSNFTDTLKLCLEIREQKALNVTLEILKQLGEFVCFRDGDRIAMFVAEGGVECITNHTEGIKNCVNSTFKINPVINTNSLPNLLIDKNKCDDLSKFQNCVVEELEKCKDTTPANIVDALLRFIKRSACSSKNRRSVQSEVYSTVDVTKNVYNLFKEKCDKSGSSKNLTDFTAAAENTTFCIKNGTEDNKIFEIAADKYKEFIGNCFSDLIGITDECLAENEKYWPQFYMDSVYSVIDFMYANKNKLFDQKIKFELLHCLRSFRDPEVDRKVAKCVKDQETNNDNFDKKAVCKRLTNFRTCISNLIKAECIPDKEISQLKNDFFNALTAPCNKQN